MSADTRLLRWPERDREDYERFAAAIDRVRAAAAQARGEIVAPMPTGPEEPEDVERARAILAHRRRRDSAAGAQAELFGEPGWDILLILFIAFEEERVTDAAEIARACGVRLPILSRWVRVLEQRGLIRASRVDEDGKEALALTDEGLALTLRCVSNA